MLWHNAAINRLLRYVTYKQGFVWHDMRAYALLQTSVMHLSLLLWHVADSHRRRDAALLVGYTMKPSRERNLASRGLLPLTAPHGVCFVPVDFARPLEQQGPFDIMLHKVRSVPKTN